MRVDWEEIHSSLMVGMWAVIEYILGCFLILLALWYFWLRPIFE